jgi:hypothetical protein
MRPDFPTTRKPHAQARSGLSIAAFCRERGIAASTFHYWRKRPASPEAEGEFVELHLDEGAPAHSPSPIRLDYRGAALILPEGFSDRSLRRLLAALKESLPC